LDAAKLASSVKLPADENCASFDATSGKLAVEKPGVNATSRHSSS
jgi:hypothetical protein